jgi:hypothetical protein
MTHAMHVVIRLRSAGGCEVIDNSSIGTLCSASVSCAAAAADGLTYSTHWLSAAEAEHVLPKQECPNTGMWLVPLGLYASAADDDRDV